MPSALRTRRVAGWLVDHPWVVLLAAAAVLLALWARGTRTMDHAVRVRFDEAVSLYPGLDVRVDGLDAGKIKAVEHEDGGAIVTLGLADDEFWPLHEGTTATLRFGTTIGNGTRIVDLDPGPAKAPAIPENGIIPTQYSVETTEFDDLFDTFDGKTRTALRGMLAGTGATFGPRAKALRAGIDATAPGMDAIAGMASDLAADEPALRGAVANTNRVTRTLASRREAVAGLVAGAAATFDAFAANTRGITESLDRFPGAQREAQTTLARLEGSLDKLDGLVGDMRPGARELSGLSTDLRPALAQLRATVPLAVQAFRTARRASPQVTKLLRRAQPFSTQAAPAFTKLAPMAGCLRPYAPEIGGFLGTWASWTKHYDATAHIGRLWVNSGPGSLTSTPVDADTVAKSVPGQSYALVRPPGYNAGKPWYLPDCGAGPDGVDSRKDPEAGKVSPEDER